MDISTLARKDFIEATHHGAKCCCSCQSRFELINIVNLQHTGYYLCLQPDLMLEMGRVACGLMGEHGFCECYKARKGQS